MKRLFFGLLTTLTFAACSSDPVYYGMTPQQKEDYSKAIAGEYTGTYVILYNDGGGDEKSVKIKNSQMTITDQTMHSVCFHDYPVSQLSGVVADSGSQALWLILFWLRRLPAHPMWTFWQTIISTTCRTMAMPTGALSLRPFHSRSITAGQITTWC